MRMDLFDWNMEKFDYGNLTIVYRTQSAIAAAIRVSEQP